MTFPLRSKVSYTGPLFSDTFPLRSFVFKVTTSVAREAGNDISSLCKEEGEIIRDVPKLMTEPYCIVD
jgi:hypothetical protein